MLIMNRSAEEQDGVSSSDEKYDKTVSNNTNVEGNGNDEKVTNSSTGTGNFQVKRLKRNRSGKACLECRNRKVRCDVITKSYPYEKCTNCTEFGTECVIPKRKRKKTKKEMIVEKERIRQEKLNKGSSSFKKQEEKQNLKLPFNKYSKTESSSQTLLDDSNETSFESAMRNKLLTPEFPNNDLFSKLNEDTIILDSNRILSPEVNSFKLSQFFKVLTSNYGLKLALNDYYKCRGKITLRDLVTDECLKTLKLAGCFILPSIKKCEKYISAYLENYQVLYPILSISAFRNNFKDLYNPESLLLLRCMLYLGCLLTAKTKEEHKESRILYEKAKLLLQSNSETNGAYLVLSILILETLPSKRQSLKTLEDNLSLATRVALAFGMHRDVSNINYLTTNEKLMYKRLYYALLVKDRIFALSFSKNFNINPAYSNVTELKFDDFHDTCSTIEDQDKTYMFYKAGVSFQKLTDRMTVLQKKANLAALKNEPIMGFVNEMESLFQTFYESKSKWHDPNQYTLDSLIFHTHLLSLNLFVQRVNKFRMHFIAMRALECEEKVVGSSKYLGQEDLTLGSWINMINSIHKLINIIIKSLPKFKNQLIFSQNSLFLIFQAVVGSLPFLYYQDENVRKMMKKDLDQVIPILEDTKNVVRWGLIDTCMYLLKNIYPDENKLIKYCRVAINAPQLEDTFHKLEKYPFILESILKKNPVRFLPTVISPKLTTDEIIDNYSKIVNDENNLFTFTHSKNINQSASKTTTTTTTIPKDCSNYPVSTSSLFNQASSMSYYQFLDNVSVEFGSSGTMQSYKNQLEDETKFKNYDSYMQAHTINQEPKLQVQSATSITATVLPTDRPHTTHAQIPQQRSHSFPQTTSCNRINSYSFNQKERDRGTMHKTHGKNNNNNNNKLLIPVLPPLPSLSILNQQVFNHSLQNPSSHAVSSSARSSVSSSVSYSYHPRSISLLGSSSMTGAFNSSIPLGLFLNSSSSSKSHIQLGGGKTSEYGGLRDIPDIKNVSTGTNKKTQLIVGDFEQNNNRVIEVDKKDIDNGFGSSFSGFVSGTKFATPGADIGSINFNGYLGGFQNNSFVREDQQSNINSGHQQQQGEEVDFPKEQQEI